MIHNPTKLSRLVQLILFGGLGLLIPYGVITTLYSAIKSGSFDELYFTGRAGAFIVNGYEALFLYAFFLIFGLMFLFLAIEQIKLILTEWSKMNWI